MSASSGNQWEELRKYARQIENEIDLKLVSFSKLGTNYNANKDYRADGSNTSDSIPLLSSANSDHMFETMATEIEQLLTKLTDVNNKMAEYCEMNGSGSGAAIVHTLQRHRDILQDYGHEFSKTKSNIQSRRDREDLLGSVRKDIDAFKNSSGLNRRADLYLKEHEHIRNSERLVDDQISVAIETKEHLINQRNTFKAIQSKVNDLANRFPVINSIVQRINLRKRRDSIILGSVIGVCLLLMILYALH